MIQNHKTDVFSAVNFHADGCGMPPDVHDDGSGPMYYGYYVNRHGEQWVVAIDPAAQTGVLRGGDLGWNRAIQISEGQIDRDLLLSPEEHQWLDACWQAACHESLKG
jgi:hypothetical protein